jgi:radical SAM superfamily enzyme YgiQ (UPF0313 family)
MSKLILVPPYPLLYLATAARKAGYNPVIIDARVISNSADLLEKELQNADYLGISAGMNYQVATALLASKKAKEMNIPVIWGGSYSTFHANEFIKFPYVDYIFLGGAEKNFQDFLEKGIDHTHGIVYKKDGIVKCNKKRIPYNLNEYFPPAWDLVDPQDYIRKYKDLRLMNMTTSRGCPHRCLYCYQPSMWDQRWSHLSIENVKEEISLLLKKTSMNAIYFFDDNFAVNKDRVFKIGNFLDKNNLKWSCLIRASYLTEKFVKQLAELNCNKICIGAESGSQKVLDFIKKDIKVRNTVKAAKLLGKYALNSEFFFMTGFYDETEQDRQKTLALIDYVEEIAGTETFLRVALPFKGTPYYEIATKNGFQRENTLMSLSEEKWDFNPPFLPWLSMQENKEVRTMVLTSMIRFIWKKSFKDLSLYKKFIYSLIAPLANLRWKYKFWGFPIDIILYRTYVHLKNRKRTKKAEKLIENIRKNFI